VDQLVFPRGDRKKKKGPGGRGWSWGKWPGRRSLIRGAGPKERQKIPARKKDTAVDGKSVHLKPSGESNIQNPRNHSGLGKGRNTLGVKKNWGKKTKTETEIDRPTNEQGGMRRAGVLEGEEPKKKTWGGGGGGGAGQNGGGGLGGGSTPIDLRETVIHREERGKVRHTCVENTRIGTGQ